MARTRLVAVDQSERTPARTALAEAIANKDAIASALNKARNAVSRAEQMVINANAEVVQAEEDVKSAKERYSAAVRQSAEMNTAGSPDSASLREARIAEADAYDRLGAAKSALTELQAEIAPREYNLERANTRVAQAAKAVIADEVTQWREQLRQLHDHYVAQLSALYWLIKEEIIQDDDPSQYGERGRPNDPMLRITSPSVSLLTEVLVKGLRGAVQSDRNPSRIRWQTALAALQADPDAELPS